MLELTDISTASDRSRLQELMLITGAGVIGALVLLIVRNPLGPITFVLVGVMALIALTRAWVLSRRDPIWLGFVLLIWELLSACVFVPDKLRPIISYGLTFLFCFPAIPIVWRIWKTKSNFRLYLVYFGWCLVTVTYSLARTFSFAHLIRSCLMFAGITLCSLQARKTGNIHRTIRYLMLACIVVTVAAALAAVILPHSITWGTELRQSGPKPEDVDAVARFQGPFDNPSRLGELALVTIGLILTYFEFADRKQRILLIGAAILALWLTILADSRSGILALIIGSCVYAVWRYRLKGLMVLIGLSMLGGAGLMWAGPAVAPYIWRGDVWTITGRTDMWPFVIQQIAAKPITGYGYKTAGEILMSRFFPLWWGPYQEGVHNSVHNGYLAQMVGVGIPAFIFWMYIMLQPWFSLFR
ncbi:MAG TPA: O-antigen ligase family protein, partial [Candidatus Binataceae bacterium]|nr:O-antigen ligase family protein [Candidatus Binataceae bacterium]